MYSEADKKNIELIKRNIGEFPDFPKKGILFKDIFTALTSGEVCQAVKELFLSYIKSSCPDVDAVVGLDARGFLFSLMIASELSIGCVPIRKKGKLPGDTFSVEYQLEYGVDVFQLQKAALKPGQKVVVVDDLIATGGTLEAATRLVELAGAEVVQCVAIMELTPLRGRDKLQKYKVHSFIQYDED
ncbi:adenine phosphoribosyltransferase [Phlebotomus argentipes]|uniref:adenine phosphoribosyltransferase n=1 Tax=Phlebotomus argentipes TaxID=94469 RepID=UPI002892D1F4|nr:adenine phosphoribosyltransferase [Phlebotomus argentipes]